MITEFQPQASFSKDIKSSFVFQYRVGRIRNGIREMVTPWVNNLIMDAGLDKMASQLTPACFSTALFGAAVSPVATSRASGSAIFTQSGTTLTASVGFFVAADVGRLFKYGTGSAGAEYYITAFTSATQVTVNTSATVGTAIEGTIWYVNSAALTSVLQTSSTAGSNGGDNGTSVSVNVYTHKKTIVGTAVGSAVTLTEIGFSHNATNSNLFDRDIITGGVSLLTGDIPIVVCQLIQTIVPTTARAVGNVGTGFDTSGNLQLEWVPVGVAASALSWVSTTGAVSSGFLDPTAVGQTFVMQSNYTAGAFSNSGTPPVVTNTYFVKDVVVNSYTNGTYALTKTSSLTISESNTTIFGFGYRGGQTPGAGVNNATNLYLKLTTSFTKNSTQILTFTWTFLWSRTLTN